MEKIKQIHLQMHLYLGNQKPQSAENGIKWSLVQYYTIRTVIRGGKQKVRGLS